MQVRSLTSVFGAEIRGIDLTSPMSDETYEAMRRAFLDHGLIVLKHQQLTTDQFVAFCERFGRIVPHRLVECRHPDCSKVTILARVSIEEKSRPDQTGNQ